MRLPIVCVLLLTCLPAFGKSLTVGMTLVDGKDAGKSVGDVVVTESKYGVVLTPALHGLPAGLHGFHVHAKASCEPAEKDGKLTPAEGAGPHFDPANTGKHDLPWGGGHLGDLPPLYVDASGAATNPVLAPRLKLSNLPGHALMIHAGGDNHSDHPDPAGGGGARIACGVIR